jgi:hypothetical protein
VAIKDGIVALSTDPRTQRTIDISSRDEGMDVVFDRVGSGLNTKYLAFRLMPGEKPPESWYKNAPDDFEEFILKPDYAEVSTELAQLSVPSSETRGSEVRGGARSPGEANPGVVQDPASETRGQVPQATPPQTPLPQAAVQSPTSPPVVAQTPIQSVEVQRVNGPSGVIVAETRARGEAEVPGGETRSRGEASAPAGGVSPEVRDRIAQLKQGV